MSAFVKEIQDTEVEPIQPRFVDFKKDMTEGGWTSNPDDNPKHMVPLAYKQNTENGIFNLVFRLPFGTAADKRIDAACDYLELLGTDTLTAEQIQQKFYGLMVPQVPTPRSLSNWATASSTAPCGRRMAHLSPVPGCNWMHPSSTWL